MSRFKWLGFLLCIVCAVHFAAIGILFSQSRLLDSPLENNANLRLLIDARVVSASIDVQKNVVEEAPPITAAVPSLLETPSPALVEPERNVQTERVSEPASFLQLGRDKFFDLEALDTAAVGSDEFDLALDNVLPAKFEFLVLEFLIDESGRTVQISCIDGECTQVLGDKLQELLAIPFVPALKKGQPVPSRKVIQILPVPNLAL